jgi:hypothetical protein
VAAEKNPEENNFINRLMHSLAGERRKKVTGKWCNERIVYA